MIFFSFNCATALSQAQHYLTWWQFKGHVTFSVFSFFINWGTRNFNRVMHIAIHLAWMERLKPCFPTLNSPKILSSRVMLTVLRTVVILFCFRWVVAYTLSHVRGLSFFWQHKSIEFFWSKKWNIFSRAMFQNGRFYGVLNYVCKNSFEFFLRWPTMKGNVLLQNYSPDVVSYFKFRLQRACCLFLMCVFWRLLWRKSEILNFL